MELTVIDEGFYCWGVGAQGGVYLLRLKVSWPSLVRFGRYQAGEPIAVPAGDYLYVGSALGQKGSSSLARRVLRHATRSDGQNPQPIRQKLLDRFPQIGLGPTPLQPPSGKKLRWHVDFLLDELAVDLTAVYLIRSKQEQQSTKSADSRPARHLETAVARYLLTMPEVSPLAPGLGSTDDPGGTHLLRVTAVPGWWPTFPQKLTLFLRGVLA